jgi:hypothetical protein
MLWSFGGFWQNLKFGERTAIIRLLGVLCMSLVRFNALSDALCLCVCMPVPARECCIVLLCVTLSKLTQVVTLVTYSWEIMGSSLSADTDCPSVPRGRRRDIVLNWATTACLHILSISLFTNINSFDAVGN